MINAEFEAMAFEFLSGRGIGTPDDVAALAVELRRVYELGKDKDRCIECDKNLSGYCSDCMLEKYAEGFKVGGELARPESLLGRKVRILPKAKWKDSNEGSLGVIAKVCLDGTFGIDGLRYGVDDDQLAYEERDGFELLPVDPGYCKHDVMIGLRCGPCEDEKPSPKGRTTPWR